MSQYATISDFIDEIQITETIWLTNLDDPAATAINSNTLNAALIAASEIIDTYCGSRYSLPLDPAPAVMTAYCIDIARYRLDRVRSREDVRLRYEDVLKFLLQVSRGAVSIGATALGTSASDQLLSQDSIGARGCSEPAIDMSGY
jgi:phage gp36-like protein